MDILVKIERFQIKPNVINLKSTLGKEEFILETHQKIFSPRAGKLNLNFGIIGWCWQDSLAGENFPAIGLKIFLAGF